MELDKVMKLVDNLDKVRSLLAEAVTLLDVGETKKKAAAPTGKRRGRPPKAKAEDLNFE